MNYHGEYINMIPDPGVVEKSGIFGNILYVEDELLCCTIPVDGEFLDYNGQ